MRLSRVGDSSRLDFERIAQLRPDLVIAWRSGNRAGDIAQLEALGLPVFVSEPQHLSDIPRLNAVKNRHLFSLDPDLIQRPGPRILQGARQMCGQLAQVRQGR